MTRDYKELIETNHPLEEKWKAVRDEGRLHQFEQATMAEKFAHAAIKAILVLSAGALALIPTFIDMFWRVVEDAKSKAPITDPLKSITHPLNSITHPLRSITHPLKSITHPLNGLQASSHARIKELQKLLAQYFPG